MQNKEWTVLTEEESSQCNGGDGKEKSSLADWIIFLYDKLFGN